MKTLGEFGIKFHFFFLFFSESVLWKIFRFHALDFLVTWRYSTEMKCIRVFQWIIKIERIQITISKSGKMTKYLYHHIRSFVHIHVHDHDLEYNEHLPFFTSNSIPKRDEKKKTKKRPLFSSRNHGNRNKLNMSDKTR